MIDSDRERMLTTPNGNFKNGILKEEYLRDKNNELYQLIIDNTTNTAKSWLERVYQFLHRVDEAPKCKCCDNDSKFLIIKNPTKSKLKYNVYCSDECKYSDYSGEGNPFFNKSHTQELKDKFSKERTGISIHTDNSKLLLSSSLSGENNPMYGKSYYDVWVEKYGKEVADEKQEAKRINNSLAASGENNPMYGKVTTNGAGNGWSGWIDGKYFASLLELAYIIYCENNRKDCQCISGKNEFKVLYSFMGKENRSYFPDYLVDGLIIEVKPYRLKSSPNNVAKFKAAIDKYGDRFVVVTEKEVDKLSDSEIKLLIESGRLKFTKKYEELYAIKFR